MINIEESASALRERFPEFIKIAILDISKPYILFSEFGLYIRDGIDNDQFTEDEIKKIFNFMNQMGLSEQDDVHNLLTVGLMEILIDSNKAIDMAKKNLTGKALEDFKAIQKFWDVND